MYSSYRNLFRLPRVLACYLRGDIPSVKGIREDLFLTDRDDDRRRPDHLLKNTAKLALGTVEDVGALLDRGLTSLADTFLPPGPSPLTVPRNRFAIWQEAMTDHSPLVVTAKALARDEPAFADAPTRDGVARLMGTIVGRQVGHGVLPTVWEPRLDHLIEREGLDEMHMHLNGASDAEYSWLDALARPGAFARDFLSGRNDPVVLEQLHQIDRELTHERVLDMVEIAACLRHRLAAQVLGGGEGWSLNGLRATLRATDPLADRPDAGYDAGVHPLVSHFNLTDPPPSLVLETTLMAFLLAYPSHRAPEWFDHALYAYLLIFHCFRALLVQQRDQYGFDQFQKITLNQMRELTEAQYLDRFRQLDYRASGDLDLLEGRYAPKGTYEKLGELFRRILSGYRDYHGASAPRGASLREVLSADGEDGNPWREPLGRRMRLGLVGHLIKARDGQDPNDLFACRHYAGRGGWKTQARMIARILEDYPDLRRYLTGCDAAANELHTPPEAFAPVFRDLRHFGFRHFTYHVGEDFVHLLSGIRAVLEAVRFLDLKDGNRVGHGTAVGIDPGLWAEVLGEEIVVTRQDRLDDLVVAHHLLTRAGRSAAAAGLEREIRDLARLLFQEEVPLDSLYDAWTFRSLDPLCVLELWGHRDLTLDPCLEREYALVDKAARENGPAYRLLKRYHEGAVVARGRDLIPVPSLCRGLDRDDVVAMQNEVLGEMHERKVIIETLPTSNVRISVYTKLAQHHLFRWLGLTDLRPPVPVTVVVGSDDPGIFSTNLRNEYAHILWELDALCDGTALVAEDVLARLARNGKTYRFPLASVDHVETAW